MSREQKFLETVKSIGIALLVALSIRAFVIEPFKIPSGSMIPTLLIGDQIFVNKFVYGIRVPFTKKRFWKGRDPKRGEVIVFMYPKGEKVDYIKRVVGLPGDHVQVEGENVRINGEPVVKESLVFRNDPSHNDRVLVEPSTPYKKLTLFPDWEQFSIYREALGNNPHLVQYRRLYSSPQEFQIPDGKYFVMGDNRDNSQDSRIWGFVPRENIKGEAMFIWLSIDWDQWGWRWEDMKTLFFWPKMFLRLYELSLSLTQDDVIRGHRFARWIH